MSQKKKKKKIDSGPDKHSITSCSIILDAKKKIEKRKKIFKKKNKKKIMKRNKKI